MKDNLFTIRDDIPNGLTHTFHWHNVEDLVLDGKLIHVVCRTCLKVFHFDTVEKAKETYYYIINSWQSKKN